MDEKSVTRPAGPPGFCGAIADQLERVVEALRAIEDIELPEPRQFQLNIQPGGTSDTDVIEGVDVLGSALLGKQGSVDKSSASPWYSVQGQCGPVDMTIYRGLSRRPDERDAEIEKLRARVAELEAGQ